MQCENNYCIYWESGHCILDELSLDFQGRCQECVYVPIDDDILQHAMQKILGVYESEFE